MAKNPLLKPKYRKSEVASAYCFLAPSLIAFIAFVVIPFIMVIGLSFTKYNVLKPAQWNDYKNWIVLSKDKRFWNSLIVAAKFTVLIVPMHMIVSFFLALIVSNLKNKAAVYFFRTVYYFPTLLTTASVAIAWTYMFNYDFGLINYVLNLFGIEPIKWLNSSFWVYPATMLFSLWKFCGGYFLYLFVGFQSLDKSCLEAASIDGANAFQKFRYVTFPLVSPTVFFVLVTNLIGCIRIFDEPYMLTSGGPGDATRAVSLYIYETAFFSHKYGNAAAQSIVFTLIILLVTLVQFKMQGMWVNYDRD